MREYLRKRLSFREKQLHYDFLPSMLELIERPANRAAGLIIWLIALTFVSVLVWAYIFRLDVVVTARGVMLPEDSLIALQSEYSGMVSELFVEEAERIEKDAPILGINQTGNEMKIDDLEYELELLRIQKEIYEEIYAQLIEEGNVDVQEGTGETDSATYEMFASIVDSIRLEQEIYLNQEKQYELQIATATTSDEKKLLSNQLESFQLQRRLTLIQNINSLDVKLHDKEAELAEAEYLQATKTVKAPMAGRVTQLAVSTPGTYVTAGQTFGYLIPADGAMIFRAYVSGSEVEHINEGDEVQVRLAALDDSEYELVEGSIERIGGVTVNVDGIGSAYEVEIRMAEVPERGYRVGMEGTCDIIVGKRRVLDYFLEPFEKGLQESLKES